MVKESHPKVSIVLPAFQERDAIFDCLESLRRQDYPSIDEVLVVDGGSKDGTREIVRDYGWKVRLVDNPRVTAAAAMNVGIAAAKNEIVVRADAHTIYAEDYVSRSVEALRETSATVVGGPMRPVGITRFGRAVAAVTSSPFGIGPGRFHYSDRREFVETVYLGTFLKTSINDVGGYDEVNLQWAAEDQELNYRLRLAGGQILLDPTIRSQYFPRQTPAALRRQYQNYGLCKASTLKKHKTLPYWRPLVPAMMVAGTALWLLVSAWLGLWWLIPIPLVIYCLLATAISFRLSRPIGIEFTETFRALSICHWAYGLGFLQGLARILFGRPFDNRPKRRV